MDRKEYRRNSEIIASLLLPLKMHCNENTNKCIDETLLNQWFANTCFYDDEDNLFPEYKRRQADTCCLEDIITDVGLSEVLKRVKAYEEKEKAEKEIKVGDEVKDLATNNIGVVLGIGERVLYITKFDYVYSNTRGSLEKTGRHFGEVEQLLDKMKGE